MPSVSPGRDVIYIRPIKLGAGWCKRKEERSGERKKEDGGEEGTLILKLKNCSSSKIISN